MDDARSVTSAVDRRSAERRRVVQRDRPGCPGGLAVERMGRFRAPGAATSRSVEPREDATTRTLTRRTNLLRALAALALVVQKYGGTSVGSLERIKNVATRALATRAEGHDVVVIVSAMSGETNRLLKLASDLTRVPAARELDVLAATGEQVTAALTAIAIQDHGGAAESLLGHQVRVQTDSAFTKARILKVDRTRIDEALRAGKIAVVAGFQGSDDRGNITTLGRGGSDTSAVAVAAALKASCCEIYTDVDGVYTTDPNICPSARKISRIAYEEMLELASLGAKVLQIRSVELAMKYEVPVHVRSSFSDSPGTWVVKEEGSLEDVVVAGVAYDKNDAKVQLVAVPDRPGVVARIFGELAERGVSVDMIIQNTAYGYGDATDVTFTVPKTDLARNEGLFEELAAKIGARGGVRYDEDIVKVSIVGLGMKSHAGVAAKMFEIFSRESINIQAISTSEIKISCLIASKYTELAVRALHDGFGLDKPSRRDLWSPRPATLGNRSPRAVVRPSQRMLLPRLALTLALATVAVGATGCATRYIPNTDVEDTDENRDIIRFCEQYRKAIERQDVAVLLSLASPRYYEDGGNVDPSDDLDYEGLREWLDGRFQQTKAIRYEIRYRKVTRSDSGRIFVIYTYSSSYKIPGLKQDEWRHTVADNRLELEHDGKAFKILAGM